MKSNKLRLKKLGINTYNEAVIYLRSDCNICRAEGFAIHARIKVKLGNKSILATLNTVEKDILQQGEASLSNFAWEKLGAKENDEIELSHPLPLQSLSYVRSKVYNEDPLTKDQIYQIVSDISKGGYSDIHIAMFLTACTSHQLNDEEIYYFTKAMADIGEKIDWKKDLVVDKHCVGGLPGNRTTLIVVPIVASFGLCIPKTSSRAITSPAGTADTMEVLAPVNLSLKEMKKVIEKENGCITWGGAVSLSPADDILIGVERVMDLDSGGQLIASVLSKKIAAGSNNILIDIPVGPTVKIRSLEDAENLKNSFQKIAKLFNVQIDINVSDGSQPIGRGIGPCLEAFDVLNILQSKYKGLMDLRERSLILSGKIIEFVPNVKKGDGYKIAKEILDSGKAWKKFQDICEAQGGIKEPYKAKYTHDIVAFKKGRIVHIDNRILSRLARLAGAPYAKSAGIFLHVHLDQIVEKNQTLFTIHSESKGELKYALSLLEQGNRVIEMEIHE